MGFASSPYRSLHHQCMHPFPPEESVALSRLSSMKNSMPRIVQARGTAHRTLPVATRQVSVSIRLTLASKTIYIYTHTYIIYVCIYIYVYMHHMHIICICIYIYQCMYIYIYQCMCIYIYVYINVYIYSPSNVIMFHMFPGRGWCMRWLMVLGLPHSWYS